MSLIKYSSFFLLVLLSLSIKAQQKTFGIGLGGGLLQSYGDANNKLSITSALQAEIDIPVNKRISVNTEFHSGMLINGIFDYSTAVKPFHARYFESKINGISTALTYKLFEEDRKVSFWMAGLKSLYAGAGIGIERVGVIYNNTDVTLANGDEYLFPAKTKSAMQISIPLLAGFNFDIPKTPFVLGLKGQLSIVPQDELDNYLTNINSVPDAYAIGSVTIKYYFKKVHVMNSNL